LSMAFSGSDCTSGMDAPAMRWKRDTSRLADLRRMLYASQAKVRNFRYWSLSAPPMASIISLFSFIGGGKGLGSRPTSRVRHCNAARFHTRISEAGSMGKLECSLRGNFRPATDVCGTRGNRRPPSPGNRRRWTSRGSLTKFNFILVSAPRLKHPLLFEMMFTIKFTNLTPINALGFGGFELSEQSTAHQHRRWVLLRQALGYNSRDPNSRATVHSVPKTDLQFERWQATVCAREARQTLRYGVGIEGERGGGVPMMNPKSMWNRRPSGVSMRLSRWRSPIPRMYVMTQYPAQLLTKLSTTSAFNPKGPAFKESGNQGRWLPSLSKTSQFARR
jgi:hypothetical protein